MELHQDKEGNFYAGIRFGSQKAVNPYQGYWYCHLDDCYGTKITLGEDEFSDFRYMLTNDFPKFKEEISRKVRVFFNTFLYINLKLLFVSSHIAQITKMSAFTFIYIFFCVCLIL